MKFSAFEMQPSIPQRGSGQAFTKRAIYQKTTLYNKKEGRQQLPDPKDLE